MLIYLIKQLQKIKKTLVAFGAPVVIVPTNCKFYPSCSDYAIEAIEKYGTARGSAKSFWRILKCNPLNKGGVDIP